MNRQLERELMALAHAPLDLASIERLELEAIDAMMYGTGEPRERAKLVLRMTSEIRKSRGCWDETELMQREIDDEVASVRARNP